MAAWFQHPFRFLILAALLFACGLPRIARAQDQAQELQPYLRGIDLQTGAFASAARGAIVVKLLSTRKDTDVAVFGMVRLNASPDAALRHFLDFDRSLAAGGRRFALFGDHPQPAHVVGVSFDDSEYRDLRNCVPGDCHFKLPAIGMQMFSQRIDWSAPDAKAHADRLLRDGVFELLVIVDLGSQGTYLLTVRSFCFDQLSGGVLNLRGRVREHLQAALRSDLDVQRAAIELMGP